MLDRKQKEKTDQFVRIMERSSMVEAIFTIMENKDCGLYVKKNGNFKDIPCFAVARTIGNNWFGLNKELKLYYFWADEVI